MQRIHLILSLFFTAIPHLSCCMGQVPLQPMHNPEQVIREFDKKLVVYAATTKYLTGPEDLIYPNNPLFGYISPRSTRFNFQPNIIASHSIKKLINTFKWTGWQDDQESLLTDWSVYEGQLKMRAANAEEISTICKVWCPDDYDFDYEDGCDLWDIAANYCCPANICCATQQKKAARWNTTV